MAITGAKDHRKMVHKFENSVERGERAVAVVTSLLQSKGYHVESVEDDDNWWAWGIDLVVRKSGQRDLFVEVKGDTYQDNFFFETISNLAQKRQGWVYTSSADYVAYVFLSLGVVYFIPWRMFQAWFTSTENLFPTNWLKYVGNEDSWKGGKKRTTVGYAVPRAEVEKSLAQYARWYGHKYDKNRLHKLVFKNASATGSTVKS